MKCTNCVSRSREIYFYLREIQLIFAGFFHVFGALSYSLLFVSVFFFILLMQLVVMTILQAGEDLFMDHSGQQRGSTASVIIACN